MDAHFLHAPKGEEPERLICVANRLPITINIKDDGNHEYCLSSGGLVAALTAVRRSTDFTWYGWPGKEIPEHAVPQVEQGLRKEHKIVPVWLDQNLADRHYNDFCNAILWPTLHYHQVEIGFHESALAAYTEVNQIFADILAEDAREGDLIWIHDYHLMLMPKMLKDKLGSKRDKIRIGFFLHTPFPSSAVFRYLPEHELLLKGVLECDVVGFHNYDYARHFLSTCIKSLDLSATPTGVDYNGRSVTVGAFPIGIDPENIEKKIEDEDFQIRIAELEKHFEGKTVIVGVDRLDYIKGIPMKLHAFDDFLTSHPQYKTQLILIQIAVPSRGEVPEYQHLCELVESRVGYINGKHGDIEATPIQFIHKSMEEEDLWPLYAVADIAFVTSTRDGMNLVALEYIATQKNKRGQLILSEFAGASQSLNGAILVNPWCVKTLAKALEKAMTITPEQRDKNFKNLFAYIHTYTSTFWSECFLKELRRCSPTGGPKKIKTRPLPVEIQAITSSSVQDQIGVGEPLTNGIKVVTTKEEANGHIDGLSKCEDPTHSIRENGDHSES